MQALECRKYRGRTQAEQNIDWSISALADHEAVTEVQSHRIHEQLDQWLNYEVNATGHSYRRMPLKRLY